MDDILIVDSLGPVTPRPPADITPKPFNALDSIPLITKDKESSSSIPTIPSPVPAPTLSNDLPLKDEYAGAVVDNSGPLDGSQWEVIPFENPFELITTVDKQLLQGTTQLYPWQFNQLKEFAECKPTLVNPYMLALCAANGSGKDLYIIAPFVVWFAISKKRSLTVITSSSGTQLTAQTENYIASLTRAVNEFFGAPIFKVNRRFIKCLKSGSEIRMFATDEAGKAEGYHPLEPNAEMAIIVNEAKSVATDIFGALSRCTGYNYWLNISTPGEPFGDFYDSFCNWRYTKRVSAFDCKHLPANHIKEVARKYGESSAIYRSQILALFTAIGGQVVIDQDELNKLIELSNKGLIKPIAGKRRKLGIDLAAGRDENAHVCINGNYIEARDFYQEKDTTLTQVRCGKFLTKWGGPNCNDGDSFADDGGVGHGIIDNLVRDHYKINRVLNQQRAFDFKQFGNRGAEMWYNVKRLVEEKLLYLPLNLSDEDDKKLYSQLCYRHFSKHKVSGKITLESKEEARANGHVSPDRADALVLALSDTDIDSVVKLTIKKPVERGLTIEELQNQKWTAYRDTILNYGKKKEPIKGNSLEALFAAKGI